MRVRLTKVLHPQTKFLGRKPDLSLSELGNDSTVFDDPSSMSEGDD